MQEKVGLIEYFGSSWRDHFTGEDTIISLLNNVGISDHVFKNIYRRYSIDHNRYGLVINTVKKDTGYLVRIVLDVKLGEPTWNQLMDVTYSIGADCDIKIVIFDGEKNSDSFGGSSLAESFCEVVNKSGVSIYLVQVKAAMDDGRKSEVEYEVMVDPKDYTDAPYSKLPSKRRFDEIEFWVLHYDPFCGFDPPAVVKPHCWIGYSSWRRSGDLDLTPTWTDEGFFMHAIAESGPGADTLKWLWENRHDEIREHYKGCKVKLHKKSGTPHKLSVRLWEVPFRNFIYSTADEKDYYADEFFGGEREFSEFMDSLIMDREPEKKAVKKSINLKRKGQPDPEGWSFL